MHLQGGMQDHPPMTLGSQLTFQSHPSLTSAMLDCTQSLSHHRFLSPLDIPSCILCVEWLSPEDVMFIFSPGVRHTLLPGRSEVSYPTCVSTFTPLTCNTSWEWLLLFEVWHEIYPTWCPLEEEKGKQECRFFFYILTVWKTLKQIFKEQWVSTLPSSQSTLPRARSQGRAFFYLTPPIHNHYIHHCNLFLQNL